MNALYTLTSRTYADPAKRRDYHRARYLANRDTILAEAAAKKKTAKAPGEKPQAHAEAYDTDPDHVADVRPFIERDRRETLEGIRLRLIWASSAGGDEGAVAKAAVAVIRFTEGAGGRWTDRSLRALHRRLSLAEGLTQERFDAARHNLARDLFIPL